MKDRRTNERRRPRRILVVQYSANLDGSALSALLGVDGLRAAGWETHVAFAFEGAVLDRFRAHGHTVHVAPHKSWLRTARLPAFVRNVVREVRASAGLARLARRLEPDLVYVNTVVSLAGALAARRSGVPCLWHLRELFADVGGEMRVPVFGKALARLVLRSLSDRIVANSEAVARNLLGPRGAAHAEVVYNAVDDAFFGEGRTPAEARRAFGLPETGPVLGVPGTLRPMKGHPFLFEALPDVRAAHPGLTVAVTGADASAYAGELKAQVDALGLAPAVRFLGNVHDMPAFYRACDAVCIPSVAEPFGRTVIEAFAAGTPVAASAVGGILETVEDDRTGLLVPYGDVPLLAERLRRLLADERLRTRLRDAARQEAETKYRASVYTAQIRRVVEDVARNAAVSA